MPLVARDSGVDMLAPGIDAALQVEHLIAAGLAQKIHHGLAARAVVAHDDQRDASGNFAEAGGDLTHRNVLRAADRGDTAFIRLPHIQQVMRGARGTPGSEALHGKGILGGRVGHVILVLAP
jgi:hypothetical protein